MIKALQTIMASAIVTASNVTDRKYLQYADTVWFTVLLPPIVENAMEPIGTIISNLRNLKYTVYIIKKPQIIMMMERSAASISMIRLSPKPRFLMISACVLSIISVV